MQLSKLKARSKESDSENRDLNSNLSEFGSLGLFPEIVAALSAQSITVPTPVQRSVIPRLLSRENIVMAASTGSGKTLAYALPAVQVTGHPCMAFRIRLRTLVFVYIHTYMHNLLRLSKHTRPWPLNPVTYINTYIHNNSHLHNTYIVVPDGAGGSLGAATSAESVFAFQYCKRFSARCHPKSMFVD